MRSSLIYGLLFAILSPIFTFGQVFSLPEGDRSLKVKFELINNLIVLPIEVNGTPLSFILDTGVNKPIIFSLTDQDSVSLNNVRAITIRGLGEGEAIEALSSVGNEFRIREDMVNPNQQVYVVLDRDLNFSTTLGVNVHGIIGYDLFRDFVVEINYSAQHIKFHDPRYYQQKKSKKCETLPLTIIDNKAYLDGAVVLANDKEVPVNLLVDTGSSDAVWLFQDIEKGLGVPDSHYDDFLGKGLNGDIFGKRTKVEKVRIGNFVLEDAKAAFPEMNSFSLIKNLGNRNGSLGGEILRRFNVVFNYHAGQVTLKKNNLFREPFRYNLSGIEVQHNGMRYVAESLADASGVAYQEDDSFGNVQLLLENRTRLSLVPEIIVSTIRAGSPAAEAGLQEGDVILAVNGKPVHRYKIQEVIQMLNEREGKQVRVLIERYNKDLLFSFVLKKLFE
ncbi:aspartyl protease family protein [Zeaxanthinibacter enoshimensis]|uniref:Aspartyl protease n=1 Tax=Zeaxanthinibacter enoshimensis TaxID=392009 RepID=A0A4R6TN68_9FLAO|nr:aspartyl protease family protein [Zeaxanthinibacter enoshimensis]TDQ30761.1 aspartyl protease [Zeaxanthinibacter enoshimensis]